MLDNMTSMVIYLHTTGILGDPWSMLGVSQSIQILYTQPAPVGQYIDIECSTISIGKSIAVIQVSCWPWFTTHVLGGSWFLRGLTL